MKFLFFIAVIFISYSCGYKEPKYVPVNNGGGNGGGGNGGDTGGGGNGGGDTGGGSTGGGGKPSYAATQAILNNRCARCHSGAAFMKSERGLRSSAAANRVRNQSMPPNPAGLPQEERRKILAFF